MEDYNGETYRIFIKEIKINIIPAMIIAKLVSQGVGYKANIQILVIVLHIVTVISKIFKIEFKILKIRQNVNKYNKR